MQDDLFPINTSRDAPLMGIDPQLPFYDLNLAGSQGIPAANNIAHATMPPMSNPPTFTRPDTDVPELAPYDLTEPGINLHSTLSADPLLPDLSEYTHPYGLTIQPSPGNAPLQIDPLLPDLQHPDLTQQMHMPERPGDLASDALQAMHQDATYQLLDDKTYPAMFMDATGSNTTRSRHMDLLMHGLDQEEQ